MKRHRHAPEQAVRKFREGERLLGEGQDLAEVLRHLEITESTWHRWRQMYGGIQADAAKRLKELEAENAKLKKVLAEAELAKAGRWSGNSRNGYYPKTVRTEVGDVRLDVSRDRNGSFEPATVPVGQRRLAGLNQANLLPVRQGPDHGRHRLSSVLEGAAGLVEDRVGVGSDL